MMIMYKGLLSVIQTRTIMSANAHKVYKADFVWASMCGCGFCI